MYLCVQFQKVIIINMKKEICLSNREYLSGNRWERLNMDTNTHSTYVYHCWTKASWLIISKLVIECRSRNHHTKHNRYFKCIWIQCKVYSNTWCWKDLCYYRYCTTPSTSFVKWPYSRYIEFLWAGLNKPKIFWWSFGCYVTSAFG